MEVLDLALGSGDRLTLYDGDDEEAYIIYKFTGSDPRELNLNHRFDLYYHSNVEMYTVVFKKNNAAIIMR